VIRGFCKGFLHGLWVLGACCAASVADESPAASDAGPATPGKVMVIPIRAEISPPELYILRRGIREAIEAGADTLILDMETPGGRLDVTFDILQALERFPGRTVTYVNAEAISAGALIAMGTDEIWFKPGGLIGAAAPVMSGGAEIGDTMKAKLISYLLARARSITEGQGYRSQVITAMIDVDYEFKIGDEVISPKGALLTLTASEAAKPYGDPPMPLLASGIVDNLDELVERLHGSDAVVMNRLEVTWSEKLAQYLVSLTPLLMGLGMLFLFIEFRTPGFGVFGLLGGVFLGIVFFGHYAAGLSGYEPVILFILGVILVLVEVLFVPGILVGIIAGVLMILTSLLWAMADFLPKEPITFSGDLLMRPLLNLASGILIAVLVFLALVRFLPHGGLWGRMVLETSVAGEPGALQPIDSWAMPGAEAAESRVGLYGKAVTALYPSGQVEIGGRRYEARLEVGMADPGTPVRVVRESEFALIVEVMS
jgi:membrane-bound serine protease (ClpP class)